MTPAGCKGSSPAAPPSPSERPCCLLMPYAGPVARLGIGVVDPAAMGTHHFGGGDVYGILYTCAAGFFDLGHARDLIDITRYYHHYLTVGGRNAVGATIPCFVPGTVTVNAVIPAGDVIETAASMAYDEAVWHEIQTWWQMVPGGHNSSFSPEDLVSNFLGAWVGRRALLAGGAFDAAATSELSTLVGQLGGRPPADTNAAFAAITGRWVASGGTGYADTGVNLRYVLRRNFDFNPVNPWFAPGIAFCPATTWPAAVPKSFGAAIGGYYDIEFKAPPWAQAALGATLKRSAFAGAITTIKGLASAAPPAGYGPDYATP